MRTTRDSKESSSDVRERILETSLQVFAEKGFEGATTRLIAGKANVPLGLIRYYFGGKLKLWQSVVDKVFGEVRSVLDDATFYPRSGDEEAKPTGELFADPIDAIRAGIRGHVRYVANHPEFVRLMHEEGKRRGPRMRWLVDRHVKPLFEQLLPVIVRLQELGRLPKDIAPMHFCYALIGAIDVIFHQAEECRRVTGVDPSDPDVIEAHARAVEFMILGNSPID